METNAPARPLYSGSTRTDRTPKLCLAFFGVAWVALAINPTYRADWLLENLLTFVAVPVAVLTFRRFRFSDQAYVQATVFLILHTIGSHYTYSEVPLGELFRDTYGLTRNHYDRAIHFGFGLLLLRPMAEAATAYAPALRRRTALWVAFSAVLCVSGLYEILEWLVASVADPEAGTAYLGMQGDIWDSQKDMALAGLGALLGVALASVQLRWATAQPRTDHSPETPDRDPPIAPGDMLE